MRSSNLRAAARQIRNAAREAYAELDDAAQEAALHALRIAVLQSSGTFRARGQYSRRKPNPPFDPAVVNMRSGEFVSRWKLFTVYDGQSIRKVILNDAPHAQFFDGKPTKRMIARPVIQRLEQSARPVFEKSVNEALRRAITS